WKLKLETIDELFDRAAVGLSSDESFEGAFGDARNQSEMKLLHRVAFGVQLDGPPIQPTTTRDYQAIARDVIVREYAERLRSAAFVAQLALAAGKDIAASVHARSAAEHALPSTLAARRPPVPGEQWPPERLAPRPPG